jgi:muramidase (phage lysozyme)
MRTLRITLAVIATALTVPAVADAQSVASLVRHAGGNPFACNMGSRAWSVAENKCVATLVFGPRIRRQAMRIIRCESNWNERDVNGSSGASGLGQFLRSTWRNLPRRFSRHSVFHPVWNLRGMRYLRMHDGDFHQWVCR